MEKFPHTMMKIAKILYQENKKVFRNKTDGELEVSYKFGELKEFKKIYLKNCLCKYILFISIYY